MLANMIPVHAYDAFIDADIIIEKKKPNNPNTIIGLLLKTVFNQNEKIPRNAKTSLDSLSHFETPEYLVLTCLPLLLKF